MFFSSANDKLTTLIMPLDFFSKVQFAEPRHVLIVILASRLGLRLVDSPMQFY
jgi:hypothetical protein